MAELRIGTCSWKYPSWEGLVYSSTKGRETPMIEHHGNNLYAIIVIELFRNTAQTG